MNDTNWRMRTFIIGGVVGALFGVASAYIYVRAAEKQGQPPELAPSDAVGLGLTALDLFPPARHFVAKRMIWGARAWP